MLDAQQISTISQTVAVAVARALSAMNNTPAPVMKPKAKKVVADGPKAQKINLVQKDKKILAGFAKLGIKDVVLMDRNNKQKPFNVKPFQAWKADGRIVRKGQHGVMGLFHVSQTDKV